MLYLENLSCKQKYAPSGEIVGFHFTEKSIKVSLVSLKNVVFLIVLKIIIDRLRTNITMFCEGLEKVRFQENDVFLG